MSGRRLSCIGADVRELRRKLGCSQATAAVIAGVRRQDIWNAEHGHRHLSREAMFRLFEAVRTMRAEAGLIERHAAIRRRPLGISRHGQSEDHRAGVFLEPDPPTP